MIARIINHRYKIISLVAEGGMARVYKALDIEKDHIVALKILKSQFSGDKDFIDRFMQEAMAFARLNHENIVKLYDYGSVDDLHYLSLEFIEGPSLDQIIKEKGRLSLEESLDIAIQVAKALEHAHQKRIIHRDIKPHNILVNQKGQVKVTDFGIAKAISSATITHAGGMLGSVQYFSPEQAKGERAREASDLYSLAVVMYEMLTGALPFSGESHFSIALKHVQERPTNPSFYNSAIPEKLELIILKTLSKNPNYRYPDAKSLREALANYEACQDLDKKEINRNLQEVKISDTVIQGQPLARGGQLKKINKKALGLVLLLFLFMGGFYLMGQNVRLADLEGMTVSQAEEILQGQSLKVKIIAEIFSDQLDKGLIIDQDPQANQKVKKGSLVGLFVSAGNEYVIIPDLVGSNIKLAEKILEDEKILIGSLEEIYNDDFPQGEIIYQEPARGGKVPLNSNIDLVVSKGKKPSEFPAPRLIGFSQESALEIIGRLNLQAGEITPIESFEYSLGTIVGQKPEPDALVRDYTKINLLVSQGPGPRKFSRAIPINLENDGLLKIVVHDINGQNVFLHERREKGFFSIQVDYFGEGKIEVFLDDKKINEVQVP